MNELIVQINIFVNPFIVAAWCLPIPAMAKSEIFTRLDELLCFRAYSLNLAFGRFYQSAFSETGLTYPKFVILKALAAEGPLTVSALSAKAGVEANTLSPLLKKMAGFGLLSRERSAEDERRVLISMTDLGRAILERADAVVLEGFQSLGLDEQDLEQAVQFLDEARQKVDAADPPKLDLGDLDPRASD